METAVKLRGQAIWGWKIAAYLFLAGVGAGAYATGIAIDIFKTEWVHASKVGVLLGAPLVAIGTLFLISDLGQPAKFYRAGLSPGTSWIARGVFILSVFIILGFLHIAAWIWPLNLLKEASGLRLALDGVNGVFAVLTMVYTGVLLGAVRPIPFWSTPILPLLFLASALSTGIMGMNLLLSAYGLAFGAPIEESIIALTQADAILIAVELMILLFYLQAAHATVTSRASASLMIEGELSSQFWGGVVVAGLLLPLGMELLDLAYLGGGGPPAALLMAVVVAVPGLLGGLLLRHLVIAGGVKAPLNIEGVLIATPSRDRF